MAGPQPPRTWLSTGIHLIRRRVVTMTSDLERLRPAAGEDGESPEDPLLGRVEQHVAPVDRGAECLLGGKRDTAPAHQEREALVEPPASSRGVSTRNFCPRLPAVVGNCLPATDGQLSRLQGQHSHWYCLCQALARTRSALSQRVGGDIDPASASQPPCSAWCRSERKSRS